MPTHIIIKLSLHKIFILACFILLSQAIIAQNTFTISGNVNDSKTGESMIGVVVSVKELPSIGTTTNAYGFYSLSLKEGKYTFRYRFTGDNEKDSTIQLNRNIKLNIEMAEKIQVLDEVVISSEAIDRNVSSTQMSVEKINVKEITSIPVFLGEKDIFKTIQLLPGIKGVTEANTNFYVRGGGADQNLILLDEATVYNPAHLLGFFSVFNSDAIKDVTIYKGGIPAEYGGRISSAIDIKMNDGNNKKFTATGGVGLISSRLTIEAPIVKNKGSFIISGRRTYADLFLKLGPAALRNTSLYFYDLNVKANYQLSNKDRVYLSGYFGRDNLGLNSNNNRSTSNNWGNTTATLRWNHIFNSKLFLNSSFIFSDYAYNIALGNGDAQFTITSGIRDYSLKEDFQYYISQKHTLKFGASSIYHTFIPGEVTTGTASTTGRTPLSRTLERKYTLESGIYISDKYAVNNRLTLDYGLRYSLFNALGPGTVYSYDASGNITDSSTYKNNQNIKTYMGVEPRVSFVYLLNSSSSIKGSYNRIYQYMHLLSNTTSSTPVDLWIPCSQMVKPQIGDQVALGYFKNLHNNMYESSVEVYYKYMQNQIDYKDGADLRFNTTVESQLYFGQGWAYGAEFLLKKKYGKLTGWIGYTLARTLRQFDSINHGNMYPAKQDIINSISVVGIYKLNDKFTISATWVYSTGFAVTFPSGKYTINGQVYNLYSERNGYRLPDYHRLDVGLTWQRKKTEKYESSWNFSIYNVYARENAYSISFQQDPNDPTKSQAVQLSLFRFVPAITYNFKFK